ncbi:MAG: AAA family ATPase, partial [Lachnospiraceae bacterium]|nr:AAA family ATPase [Lachnospiraceae bacterium]
MGIYLNPGNEGFGRIAKKDYVDKTGLLGVINRSIDTSKNLICISRPRRFGKSYAASMLCAYYDCSCDSGDLFSGFSIEEDETFRSNLNSYNVILLDIAGLISEAVRDKRDISDIPRRVSEAIRRELVEYIPELE